MAEHVLARLAYGVADSTIRGEITAVEQFLEHAGVGPAGRRDRAAAAGAVRAAVEDLHFCHGPLGKIHVRLGKGSRGSGPRERMVPMLGVARPLRAEPACRPTPGPSPGQRR
jgi:hypothetical protein